MKEWRKKEKERGVMKEWRKKEKERGERGGERGTTHKLSGRDYILKCHPAVLPIKINLLLRHAVEWRG
jgi:hypothetical protein